MPPKGSRMSKAITKLKRYVYDKGTQSGSKKATTRGRASRQKGGLLSFNQVFNNFHGADPFPERLRVKMAYNASAIYTAGTAGVLGTQQAWRLNSIFDPDLTGGGHYVFGYNTLSTAYNLYKVTGVEVDITMNDPSEDGLGLVLVIMNPANSSDYITGSTLDITAEKQYAALIKVNDSGSQVMHKRFFIPIWKTTGLTKLQYDADPDSYTSLINNNPLAVPRLLVSLGSYRGNTGGTCIVNTRLTYHVQLYQRKILVQST